MLFLLVVGVFGPGIPVAAEPVEAGIAVVDMTPPLGYRLSGYYHERLSMAVHDPLLAKALVLRQGETQAALVFCDIIGIPQELLVETAVRMLRELKQ